MHTYVYCRCLHFATVRMNRNFISKTARFLNIILITIIIPTYTTLLLYGVQIAAVFLTKHDCCRLFSSMSRISMLIKIKTKITRQKRKFFILVEISKEQCDIICFQSIYFQPYTLVIY